MPVDTSIYGQIQPVNPLKGPTEAVGLATGMQQNKLLQTQNEATKLGLAVQHFDNMQKLLAPALNNPNLGHKDMVKILSDGIAQKLITPEQAALETANWGDDTPEANRKIAEDHFLRAQDAATQARLMLGDVTVQDTGNALMPMTVSPMNGVRPVGRPMYKQFAPGQSMGFDPVGKQPIIAGAGPSMGVPSATFEDPAMPSQSEPIEPGANIYGPRDRNMAAQGLPPTLPAGPRLGQEAAANVTSQASAQQGVQLQQTADSVPQRKALLGQMEGALGDFNSGPGADRWKTILAGTNRLFGVNSDRVASQEEFDKLSTQLAQQQFQALGGTGTDDKLDSARKASPNSFLSNYGNKKIIALLKGNEDAISAKNSAWQEWQKVNGPESYGEFSKTFNQHFDPRAFQMQYMSPKEIKSMLNGMTKNEKEKLREVFNTAVDVGWIPDKRAQNAE